MRLRGLRTYISAIGGVMVSVGAGIAAFQSHDWQAMAMAGSAGMISLAQTFQRSATERNDPQTIDDEPLPNTTSE